MSKKKSPSEGANEAVDLSALDLGNGLGPAWARNEPKKPRHNNSGGGRGHSKSTSQGSDESGKKRQPQRREHSGNDRRNDRNDRPHFKKRDSRRGDQSQRSHSPRRAPVAPPEGVKARIMPAEEGLDALAKQISDTGRTHSVFELAWLVLGGTDRFHVIFESEEAPLYRSKSDQSVWLTQAECLAHFWAADLSKNYYGEETVEVEAPSGNFPSVARCGLSRRLIAPPNHHSYQKAIADLHAESYSHMSLDQYKSKVIVENSEEVIAEWKESMTKSIQWSPKCTKSSPVECEASTQCEAAPEGEAVAETQEVAECNDQPAAEALVLKTRREVEEHFIAHGFAEEFEQSKTISAAGNIAVAMINPALFSLLKSTVAEQKRYPGDLASILCKQMSGRHLAVFKWKKRLHCGPARPKLMPEDLVIADRPRAIYEWIAKHPAGNIDEMWQQCLPADVDEESKKQWYHDLRWLINEGQVLLLSDGKLNIAKEKKTEAAAKPKQKAKAQAKDEAKTKSEAEATPEADKPAQES